MTGRFCACTLVVTVLLSTIYSQTAYDGLPKIMPSSIVEDVQSRSRQLPKLSPQSLADFANQELALKGFEIETDPCDASSTETTLKYPTENEGTVFHLYSSGQTRFLARQPEDAPCGCWLGLPVTSISKTGMIAISSTGALAMPLPEKFLFEENQLVDSTLKRTTRSWVVPGGGPPDGISKDGTRLYIEIGETPLFLEVSGEGVLRFVPRTSPAVITKFVDLIKFPKDPDNDYLGFRQFRNGRKTLTVKFSHVCS